eukprot:Hpha_TRINITY_DN14610_c0_g1::TRINITY_DN14610_c0_g1_i1::g.48280::m.48280
MKRLRVACSAVLLLLGVYGIIDYLQPTAPTASHPDAPASVDFGEDKNVLFVHMRQLVLTDGCDVRLGQVMLEAQRRGWKPHYFHFGKAQPVKGSEEPLCGKIVKDWALGLAEPALLPRGCAFSSELCLNEKEWRVQNVEGLEAPEYAFPGQQKDERFCDGVLAVLELMSIIRFRAVIAPVWFWGRDAIPGHLFPNIREVLALRETLKSVKGTPYLMALSDDAHTVRESLLASTETCRKLKRQHLETRDAVYVMERRVYAHSDAVVFISHYDLELSRIMMPDRVPSIVSNGIIGDVSPIPERSPRFGDRWGFLFVGNGMNPTNYQGMAWFFRKVWPLILREIPEANVKVIGALPKYGSQCASFGCHCEWYSTRRAPPDRYFEEGELGNKGLGERCDAARVMIVPVVSATGVITKSFQAYKNHIPLVLTDVAARGLDRPVDSLGAVVTKTGDAEAFAEAAIHLHRSEEGWNNVRRNMNTFALNDAQLRGNEWFEAVHKFIQTGTAPKPSAETGETSVVL